MPHACTLQKLRALGLRPDTAFGCVVNFLLDLQPSIKAKYADVYQKLNNPRKLKIGIQIRQGDGVLSSQPSFTVDAGKSFWSCAEEVERTRGPAYPEGVLWFIVTDARGLKEAAVQKWGDKIVQARHTINIGHSAEVCGECCRG